MTEWHLGVSNNFPSGEMVKVGRTAGDLGFSAIWMADIRFWRDCYTVLGAIAASAGGIRIGSGVSDAYSRHPATLAAIAATLDELAPGRIMVGIGAGGSGMAPIGAERRQPLRTVEALIDGLRSMLNGQSTSVSAPGFSLTEAQLRFRPVGTVAVAMAASGPRMYQLAGRVADIAFIGRYLEPAAIDYVRERLAEGAAERSDSASGRVEEILRVDVSISDRDPAAAHDVMRSRVDGLMRSGYRNDGFLGPIGLGTLAAGEGPLGREEVDLITERVSLFGTPGQVADRLVQVISSSKVSAVSLSPHVVEGQSLEAAVDLTADAIAQVESQLKVR